MTVWEEYDMCILTVLLYYENDYDDREGHWNDDDLIPLMIYYVEYLWYYEERYWYHDLTEKYDHLCEGNNEGEEGKYIFSYVYIVYTIICILNVTNVLYLLYLSCGRETSINDIWRKIYDWRREEGSNVWRKYDNIISMKNKIWWREMINEMS